MAAGVHLARQGRRPRLAGRLGDVEGIEIRAQADGTAGSAGAAPAADRGDDPGPGESALDMVDPDSGQPRGDEVRGQLLLAGGLRWGVHPAPPTGREALW